MFSNYKFLKHTKNNINFSDLFQIPLLVCETGGQ